MDRGGLRVLSQRLRSCDMQGGRSGGILIEDSATGDSALHLHHFKYGMMLSWPIYTGGGGFVKLLESCREWRLDHWETPVVVQGTWVGESTIITVVILSSGLSLSILLWNGMSFGSTLKRHRGIHESLQPVPNVQYQYFLPADCYSSQRVNLQLFWNIPVNQLKWLKKKFFETVRHQSEILIRTTRQWKRLFFLFCVFTAFCRVWLSLFPCRGPAMRPTNLFSSEWKLWNAQMFGIHPTRLLSQVAVISCRWPTTTTATGRVCSYPKNWRVLNLEHGVTSFEMGGTSSIVDPLRVRRRWVIERRSISDRNPKTSAAQLPRQRLFLPRRLTAHSLICHVSPPSPLPSLFFVVDGIAGGGPWTRALVEGVVVQRGRFLAVRWVPVQDVGLFKTRTVLHSTATNFSLWIYIWS